MSITRSTPFIEILMAAILVVSSAHANPYRQPLQTRGYTVNTVAVPPISIGAETVRASPMLAAEVLVEVQNFMPRALEPTLLVNGEPAGRSAGIAEVREDGTTVLRFIVENASVLQDNASLAVQMGDDESTRGQLMTPLDRSAIKPLSEADAQRSGLKRNLFED
jgi:hypothetical protein